MTVQLSLPRHSERAADNWDVPAAGVRAEAFVALNGVDQWVTIRGENRANPVLVLIGGAGNAFGAPFSPFVRTFRPSEARYTLVQWDPQGCGKTFAKAGRQIPAGRSKPGRSSPWPATTSWKPTRPNTWPCSSATFGPGRSEPTPPAGRRAGRRSGR